MQAARDRQKGNADLKRKSMDFQVGDKVMLKFFPWKGVVHFGKRGKLKPRYVGPFKVLEKVGSVSYKLELPKELSQVHDTFHVSNLKKCHADKQLAVSLDGLHFDGKLQFVEEPVEIMDREVKRLKQSRIQRGMQMSYQACVLNAALTARDANTNGVDSHNSGTGARRNERATRECTYPDFMKCQPLNFKGTKGVVELTQWVEKMEIVFRISNCSVENQIKFSTCTLLGNALTWWNSHVRTVGNDIAYAMTWAELNKKMTDKYCPRTKIKKLEVELWELKVKGTDVMGYNQRFQELALLCGRMFPEESDKIEKYVENKRKKDDNQQQQQNKRQNTSRAYTARTGEKKPYRGSKPLCAKCNYHHDGPCAPKCHKCNRVGHLARDCRSPANTNASNNQRGIEVGQKPTCYECGNQGHYKSDYSE
ncbi:putative reverse transcriptase domain-containing protein [Tanacetum coccineum]|uniref:Reverse transcriptase domain-containing protein n=1 Tax=Tanacetum coccineum TaxID=301880 RepID=A0ABQ5I7M3_9ASTR